MIAWLSLVSSKSDTARGANGAFPFDLADTDTPLNTEGAEIPTIASSLINSIHPGWADRAVAQRPRPGEIPAQT
jgi:hypothetical protein